MTLVERIADRLRVAGEYVPDDVQIRRLYPGAQARAGAWSWTLESPNLAISFGAQYPASSLVKCPEWDIEHRRHLDRQIDPCTECQRGTSIAHFRE